MFLSNKPLKKKTKITRPILLSFNQSGYDSNVPPSRPCPNRYLASRRNEIIVYTVSPKVE